MRLLEADSSSVPGDVAIASPTNWTAVLFFASLAFLHYCFATWSLLNLHWEAYLSLVMGTMFAAISMGCGRFRHVVTVLPRQRVVCVRSGLGRWSADRRVRFCDISAVRLTLLPGATKDSSRIELLCRDHHDIECPMTETPRQQALYLAIAIGIPLERVSAECAEQAALVSSPGIPAFGSEAGTGEG